MLKKAILSLWLLLLMPAIALAQGTGGGTQVFTNWYPQANSPSVSITNSSSANLYPGVGPTAHICDIGNVDVYVNPFGTSNSVTATTNSLWIRAGTCQNYNIKPSTTQYTYFAAITAGGSTTLYIETGLGSPTGFGANGTLTNGWTLMGTDLYTTTNNVGIGTSTPAARLDVENGSLYWPYGGVTSGGGGVFGSEIGDSTVNGISIPRTDAELQVSNNVSTCVTAGVNCHAFLMIMNNIPTTEEGTVSFWSVNDTPQVNQQASIFVDWYKGNNSHTAGVNFFGIHVVGGGNGGGGLDNVPVCLYNDDAIILGAGATSGDPCNNSKPPANWMLVEDPTNITAGLQVRTSLDATAYVGPPNGFSFWGTHFGFFGNPLPSGPSTGSPGPGAVVGYSTSASSAVFQGQEIDTGNFLPTILAGQTVTIGTGATSSLSNAVVIGSTQHIQFAGSIYQSVGCLVTDASGNLTVGACALEGSANTFTATQTFANAGGPDIVITRTGGTNSINYSNSMIINSTDTSALQIQGTSGINLDSPTGGSEGVGTINISGLYYANGTPGVTKTCTTTVVVKAGLVTSC